MFINKIIVTSLATMILMTGCATKTVDFDTQLKDYTTQELNRNLLKVYDAETNTDSVSANFSSTEFKNINMYLLMFKNKLELDLKYKNEFKNINIENFVIFKSDNLLVKVNDFKISTIKGSIFPLGDLYLDISSIQGIDTIKNFALSEDSYLIFTEKGTGKQYEIKITEREKKGLLLMIEHITRNLWT